MARARKGGKSSAAAGESGIRGKIFKWIAGVTAVISLTLGINEVVKLGRDARQRHKQVNELLASEKIEKDSGNFAGAWATLEKASQVDGSNSEVRRAQEDLGMAWLEAGRVTGENAKFSDITDRVSPSVARAAASEDRTRRADAYAHLGWADFLRTRDGVGGLDPEISYRKALAEDPDNSYANAMLGHLTLWRGGKLEDARRYFARALSRDRTREYVRGLQFAALMNSHAEEAEEETIRVANEMRKGSEKLDPLRAGIRDRIFSIYYRRMRTPGPKAEFLSVVPPAEHLATFQWLFADADFDESKSLQREYWLAALEEAAGERARALERWRSLRSKLPRDGSWTMTPAVDAAIKRLSR